MPDNFFLLMNYDHISGYFTQRYFEREGWMLSSFHPFDEKLTDTFRDH